MRRVYNRAGRALIPEPRSPEKRIKRLVRENGRTTKFVIAFESVDAPLRNDSVLTLSVCNRVKCRSCLLAGEVGDFHEVDFSVGSRRAGICGHCRRSPGVCRIAENILVADVWHYDVGGQGPPDPGHAGLL